MNGKNLNDKQKKRTINVFAFSSFLNDFGSDAIYPIWPLFVTSFLGANMAVLGFIDGLGDAIVSVSQALSGYYSDRLKKRKIFVTLGYVFGGISRIGYALSASWQMLIPFRVMDRAGKMRGAPRDAMVADLSTGKDRGKNFGLLSTLDNLGALCGILFSIALFSYLGYQKLFFIVAIPSLIAALLICFYIKEEKKPATNVFKGFNLTNLNRNFIIFLILSGLFSLASFSYSFLLVFANQFGFETTFIPVLYLIMTLAASIASLPFGKYSDRLKSRKKLLMVAYLFWIMVCGVLLFNQSRIAIVAIFILYGIHLGGVKVVQKAFVSELSPEQYRASSLGLFQLVVGLCALPASLFAGLLWIKINPFAPFLLSLFLTLASLVMLFFVKEEIV